MTRTDGHRPIATRPTAKLLEREEEQALIERWQRGADQRALGRLIEAYGWLVGKQARRFARYGLAVDDLVQEGNLALMEAVARFDTARGVRFSSYAIWWVRSAMQAYVLQNWSIVRLGSSRENKALFFRLRHFQARAAANAEDGIDRAAAALGAERDAVARMDSILRRGDLSLNAALPRSEDDVLTVLPDDRPGPEDQAIAIDSARLRSDCIERALDALNPRERAVVRARCLSEEGPTLRDIGTELGISTERVRQIEHAALAKMRRVLARSSADRKALFDDDASGDRPSAAGLPGTGGQGGVSLAYS